MANIKNDSKNIRSFGRIKSRKLSSSKNNRLINLYPKYQLNKASYNKISPKYKKINIEIGFGDGDFIYNMAKNNSQELFIGFEPYINGFVSLLSKLQNNNLPNILLFNGDFREKFQEIKDLQIKCAKIFILFPDPWPKAKHYKRRLINAKFLDDYINPILSPIGQLVVSTDHDSLKLWVLWSINISKNFHWQAHYPDDWLNFPHYWCKTKYQQKAKNEERSSIFITAKNGQ